MTKLGSGLLFEPPFSYTAMSQRLTT